MGNSVRAAVSEGIRIGLLNGLEPSLNRGISTGIQAGLNQVFPFIPNEMRSQRFVIRIPHEEYVDVASQTTNDSEEYIPPSGVLRCDASLVVSGNSGLNEGGDHVNTEENVTDPMSQGTTAGDQRLSNETPLERGELVENPEDLAVSGNSSLNGGDDHANTEENATNPMPQSTTTADQRSSNETSLERVELVENPEDLAAEEDGKGIGNAASSEMESVGAMSVVKSPEKGSNEKIDKNVSRFKFKQLSIPYRFILSLLFLLFFR